MTTKTSAQLSASVLRYLGVIDATESADSDDETYIGGVYEDVYEEMADKELVYWPLNSIPGPIFNAMRDLIANEVANAYGQEQRPEDQQARKVVLMKPFHRHVQKRSSGLPVKGKYF